MQSANYVAASKFIKSCKYRSRGFVNGCINHLNGQKVIFVTLIVAWTDLSVSKTANLLGFFHTTIPTIAKTNKLHKRMLCRCKYIVNKISHRKIV